MESKFTKQAIKAISGMDGKTKKRIKAAIDGLPDGDVKQIISSNHLYRLRVGGYRILFSYLDEETVSVERIAPRGDVYKGV